MLYLHEHHDALAQNLTDGSFVVIVALEDFFLQELARGEVEGLVGPVEPAAVEPLLTCERTRETASILHQPPPPTHHLDEVEAGLTGVVLPQPFNVDDVRLEVGLRGLHVHIVSHVVHAILEAAVLAVGALRGRLPRPPRRVLPLLSFWRSRVVRRLRDMRRGRKSERNKYPAFPLPV